MWRQTRHEGPVLGAVRHLGDPFIGHHIKEHDVMLFDMMTDKRITEVPYGAEYRSFMSRLSPHEITAIKSSLNDLIEGTEIQTAGWMPGANWAGTPYEAIYAKAARRDHKA